MSDAFFCYICIGNNILKLLAMDYSVENFTADISVDDYIERFRDERRFIGFCRECPNYGNSWGCPPFDFDTTEILRRYKNVHLIATKITPVDKTIPLDRSQELIRPERIRLERQLLEMERRHGGRSFAFVGKCLYCGDEPCARKAGKSCRHPDKVRPSLEAFGFDIGRTLSELFHIELLWGKDGTLPPYLVLVCGFFHNSTIDQFVD